jgi:hypothetical protein
MKSWSPYNDFTFFKNTKICVLFLQNAQNVPKNVQKMAHFCKKVPIFAVKTGQKHLKIA